MLYGTRPIACRGKLLFDRLSTVIIFYHFFTEIFLRLSKIIHDSYHFYMQSTCNQDLSAVNSAGI